MIRMLFALALIWGSAFSAAADPLTGKFLGDLEIGTLVPGATSHGTVRDDGLVPALKGTETVGWIFLTSDFFPTTGYSGKPIHVAVGISPDAVLTGAQLLKHSEPIVLVGIPEAEIRAVIQHYTGFDLRGVSGRVTPTSWRSFQAPWSPSW